MVFGRLTREAVQSLRTSRGWLGALVIAAGAWMPLPGSAQDARRDAPRTEAQWIQAARTAALRVNASVHAPLLCVVDVFKVASGNLSLPGKPNK